MRGGNRIMALYNLVSRVAKINTILNTTGIKVRCINFAGDESFNDIHTPQDVQTAMSKIGFDGRRTEIGTNLENKILNPLLFAEAQERRLKRPLLITTITDGAVWIFTPSPASLRVD